MFKTVTDDGKKTVYELRFAAAVKTGEETSLRHWVPLSAGSIYMEVGSTFSSDMDKWN